MPTIKEIFAALNESLEKFGEQQCDGIECADCPFKNLTPNHICFSDYVWELLYELRTSLDEIKDRLN